MYWLRRICLSVQTECTQFQKKGQRSSSLAGPIYFTLNVAKFQKDIFSLVPSSKKRTLSHSPPNVQPKKVLFQFFNNFFFHFFASFFDCCFLLFSVKHWKVKEILTCFQKIYIIYYGHLIDEKIKKKWTLSFHIPRFRVLVLKYYGDFFEGTRENILHIFRPEWTVISCFCLKMGPNRK